jgi:hypothetical protein
MDKQQIGIIGKHILIANLFAASLEVAEPIRDHGIDLIVYRDGMSGGKFICRPIQLKTATDEAFELYSKYERFPDLRMIYVWKTRDPQYAEFYCLTYPEAISVLKSLKHAGYSILKEKGHWVTTKPSEALKKILKENFQVKEPKDWHERLRMKESNSTSPNAKR